MYDEDPISDDELVGEKAFVVTDDARGVFTVTGDFELTCTDGCEVRGPDGGSGEGEPGDPAEVFVLFEGVLGGNVARTNVIEVTCVPEPGAVAMFSTLSGMLGVLLLRRARAGRRSL